MKVFRSVLLLFLLFLPFTGQADWGDDNGWGERVDISITNSSGSPLTDYQVLVTFNSVSFILDGKIQPDGDDLRFLDSNDSTVLDCWIETDTINTSSTRIWVKVPSIPNGQKTITMYYDKASASGISDGPNTFIDFIDFNTDGVISYAGGQDVQPAQFEIQDSGATLRMYGNNWKATNISLNLSNMKLDFDFKSSGTVAEINGIGFDTETNGLNANWFYKCLGTQGWGSYATSPAATGSGDWERLGMVLDDFSGNFSYLVFSNDADAGQNTNIFYRNVRVRNYTSPEPVTEVQLPVSQIVFTTSAETMYTERPSEIITIETRDASDSPRNVQADTTITLSSNSSGSQFSLNDSPFVSVNTVTISSGTSSASFYYKDPNVGTPLITVAESPDAGWTDASQQQDVVSPGAYSVAVEITSTAAATDCQVLVTFNTEALVAASQMKANGDDMRFFDSDDTTELSYWIEPDTMNTATTRIWVKVPQVPNGTKNIYMHYGNPDATPKSSGPDTFIEFIDFNTDGVISYGGGQDTEPANYEIQDSGYTLRMYGNNWKASNISLNMDSTMKLEFDFKSSGAVSEINGIGFDTETNGLNANWFYKCLGTQSWGSYTTTPAASGGGEWENLSMALDDFSGNFAYLVFSNDADAGQNTNIFYRYVRIRKICGDSSSTDVKFPLTQLVFTTSAQSIFEDRVSAVMTVQSQDIGGTGRNVDANTTINLSTTSGTGQFSVSSSPFQSVTSVTIPAGQNSVSFYYQDSAPGNYILTASESPSEGLTDAQQSITINPVSVDWHYRLPLTIQNTCGALTDYQILVPINTNAIIAEGKMQIDGDDIRFYDSDDETILSYWIETDTINTAATRLWVKVPDVPLGSKTIYLYYGNEATSSASTGPDTFVDFIDFNTDGVTGYGGASQDRDPAQYAIQDGGYTLYMYGNNWKASDISETLDGTTRLDFGFQSTGTVAEINGIGFDTETAGLNPNWFYKCLGTQGWGSYTTTPAYSQSGTWETLSLDLAQFAGTFSYLVFCNDADAGQNTEIYYRDVRIRKYCDPEPTIVFGEEESVITHMVFTTLAQTLLQNEPSSIITLQTRDTNNDPSNVNKDMVINLTTTSSGGSFSLDSVNWSNITSLTIPSGQNTISFYYKDSLVGRPTITAKEYPSMGWIDATQQVIIISRVSHFVLETSTPQVAGVPFTVTVTAKDADGNAVESYAGTVQIETSYISPDSGTYALTPETITGFENGIASALCQYDDCGTISIAATDINDSLKTGSRFYGSCISAIYTHRSFCFTKRNFKSAICINIF